MPMVKPDLNETLLRLYIVEYEQMNEDVRHKHKAQQSFMLLINTAFVAIFASNVLFSVDISKLHPAYYLFSALVFEALGASFITINFDLARAGLYIQTELVPRVKKILRQSKIDGSDIWGWEKFRVVTDKKYKVMQLMTAIQSSALLFLVGIALYLYFLNRPVQVFGVLDFGITIAIVILSFMLFAVFSVARMFFITQTIQK